jgi:hypothetical protein
MTQHLPKIGIIDIETSPLLSQTWGLWQQNVGLNQIEREWVILSFCVMPLHGKRKDIEYLDTSTASTPTDDSAVVQRLWEVLNEYDILVAHNGKRFDYKKIRARLILEGYKPHSPVKIEDTLELAKRAAAFTSNKLAWLSDKMSDTPKESHTEFPGHELWVECLKGNPRAWKVMRRYNIRDIVSLKDVYLRLRPWSTGTINMAVYDSEDDTMRCPVCGSDNIYEEGVAFTQTGQYKRFHCYADGCGAWSRSRYTLNSKDKRKSLLISQ